MHPAPLPVDVHVPPPLRFLSPTKLRTYATCPLQYRHRYVDRLQSPYTPASLIGQAIHETLESNFRAKKHTRRDLPVAEAREVFDRVWERHAPGPASAADVDDPWEAAYADGLRALEHYLSEAAASLVPHLVEHRFRFTVPSVPWPVVGTVDLVDHNGTVIDFKTTRRPYDAAYLDGDLQLMCYAIGYAAFRAGSRVRPGELPSPYFIPDVRVDVLLVGDPPSVQRLEARYDREDLRVFGLRAATIAVGIQDEQFEAFWRAPDAAEDAGVCRRCSYADRCPDALVSADELLEADGEDGDQEE